MSTHEFITDDYVADLLAKEAAAGPDLFGTRKKPSNMPKPNTRFLRHIIKDTDSHNKALLAKEAAESRARLGNLEQVAEDKRLRTNPNAKDIRKRQMGDIHAILGGGMKRRREGDGATEREDGLDHRRREDRRRDHHRRSRSTEDLIDSKRCSRHRGRLADHRGDDSDHERRRSRKSIEGDHPREDERHRRRRDRDRSRSPRRRRSSSRERTRPRRRRHERSPLRDRGSPKRTSKEKPQFDEADSDPLEELIGPMPAPRYRGRGTVAGSSGIDRRFSESYDPSTDVAMPDEDTAGSTWDDAIEAFRDRQKLRQAQEQRMRSAGFGDDQISRLSGRGGGAAAAAAAAATEEGNVKWSKAGEKREWDLGKETGIHPAGILGEFSDD